MHKHVLYVCGHVLLRLSYLTIIVEVYSRIFINTACTLGHDVVTAVFRHVSCDHVAAQLSVIIAKRPSCKVKATGHYYTLMLIYPVKSPSSRAVPPVKSDKNAT